MSVIKSIKIMVKREDIDELFSSINDACDALEKGLENLYQELIETHYDAFASKVENLQFSHFNVGFIRTQAVWLKNHANELISANEEIVNLEDFVKLKNAMSHIKEIAKDF